MKMLVVILLALFLTNSNVDGLQVVGFDGRFLRLPIQRNVIIMETKVDPPQLVPKWVLQRFFDTSYTERMLE